MPMHRSRPKGAGASLRIFILAMLADFCFPLAIQGQDPGSVRGTVVDAETQGPLAGVRVTLQGTQLGALTSADGTYVIGEVPVNGYVVRFQLIGYAPATRPDVILTPGRSVQVDGQLRVAAIEVAPIVVRAGYFVRDPTQPTSVVGLNAEEVRRAPGSVGDVSRVLHALPSTAQMMDNANDLFVRGGSPFENGFYIDDIQVPNINHFPVNGSTGGPIGMVNVEFIEDVRFSAGAFSAAYGDHLSSVVDIGFRQGNRDRVETQLEISMAGAGGTVEGPALGGDGSWFVSARRSFLDLVMGATGFGVTPQYGDLHAKATYAPAGSRDRYSVLGLFGSSAIAYSEPEAREHGLVQYGDYIARQGTMGLRWHRLWRERGYSVTTLSVSGTGTRDSWSRTATGDSLTGEDDMETVVRFRNRNRVQWSPRGSLEFGVEAVVTRADYDYYFVGYNDRLGNAVPGLAVKDGYAGVRLGTFASHVWRPAERLRLTTGVRADHHAGSGTTYVSPRFAASLDVSQRVRLDAAAGVYRQRLPTFLLSQDPAFQDLEGPRAVHAVLGMAVQLEPGTQLTIELYDKSYDFLPLEPADPALCVVDDGTSMERFRRYRGLVDSGEARSYGVEALLQKKLAGKLYGLVSLSLFRSRYRGYDGVWRDRTYDNRYLVNVVAGYKPSHGWELSARWGLAGGGPYTPLDVAGSTALNTGIIDNTRLNGARYPAYHALDVRLDRRFVLERSSITAYLNIWNAYNRHNVAYYYWNELENAPDTMYQWSFLPVIGLEWEF